MLLNLFLPQHDDDLQTDRRNTALVLLLDPDQPRRREIAGTLRAGSIAVLEAESIDDAIAILKGSAPDVAIVTAEWPRSDNHDLCHRLKSASVGILQVVHLADPVLSREGWQEQADVLCDGVPTHPVDPHALRATIQSIVRLKRTVRGFVPSAATSLLQGALDALDDHIALIGTTGEVIGVNQAWIDFAGANRYAGGRTGFGANYLTVCDAAVGEGSADAHHVAAGLRRVIAGGVEEFSFDYPCHAPGQDRWYHCSAKRTHGSGNVAAIVTHTDRTADHARMESEARFRSFVETTNEGVVATDLAGAITYLNPRMEEILRLPAAHVIGRNATEFIEELKRATVACEEVEARVRRNGHDVLDMLATQSPIRSADGAVTGMLSMLTDVTSRKGAERRLAEALAEADLDRRRLRAVMDAIPVGVGLAAPSGELTQQNAAVTRIWGGTAPKVRSAEEYGVYRAWWPATGALVQPHEWALARTLATGETITDEMVEIERFDGTRGFVLTHSASIVGDDGSALGALYVLVDITERQLAARERDRLVASLDMERQRLADVFERAPAFLAVMRGAEHVFERVNPAYEQLIGHRDVVGMPLVAALPELAGQGFVELLTHVRDTGEPFVGTQVRVELARTPGGPLETRYVDFVYQRLDDVSAEPTLVAHGVDVTEQVLAIQESQRNVRLLREQFLKLPMPTTLWEARGDDFVLVDFNEAAQRVVPAIAQSTLGKVRSDIFGVSTAEASHLRRALRENVVVRETVDVDAGPPLGRRTFELEIGPQQPDRVVVHAVDVTDRLALESQLRQVQKLDALGRLAGGVAHDFNNLLGVMMGYTGLIMEELSPDDPIAADLAEVQSAIQRAAALTAQLLAFGRQQPGHATRTDMRRILSSNEAFLTRLVAEDVSVDVDLDGPEPLYVLVDTGQLEQIVINLAVNASDAMPKGGILSVSVSHVEVAAGEATARGVTAGSFIRLTVTDTGSGIDPDTQDRIFDPFFTTKEVGKGTGLGLATVHGIVRQAGGFVAVESRVGYGSTFHVYLPEAPPEALDVVGVEPLEMVAARSHGEVILLVEDKEKLRLVTERILRMHGYEVITAALPLEALDLVSAHAIAFDCLVTDVVMPGMNGQELARRVRALRGPVPVLLLSGYARDVVERKGFVDEDMPLLHKPISAANLLRAIASLLGHVEA